MFSNYRYKFVCSFVAVTTIFSSAMAFATAPERHITLQEDVSTTKLIKLNISAGDVVVMGTEGTSLTAEVTATCQKEQEESCYPLLQELNWSKKMGSVTELGLTPLNILRYDNVNVKVKLGVPKNKKLEVNLSAGELRIDGTSACLIANVNAGEINITLKKAQVGSAKINAKVGDVKLITAKGSLDGDRSLLVGADLEWKGTGACYTKASVMAGEVQLTLN